MKVIEINQKKINSQNGFSYIDVLIAMTIFLVGILAMSGALMANRLRSQIIENQLIAKQLCLSTLESIMAAKELNPSQDYTGWDTIGNLGTNEVAGANRGVFEIDFRPIRQSPGVDGIIGTSDDACMGTGACGANNSQVMRGFERKIEIEDIPSSDYVGIRERKVKVTIKYPANERVLEQSVQTIVTDYK